MKYLTIELVSNHVKADGDDVEQLTFYADAAEAACVAFLNRDLFATQAELDTAMGGITASLTQARTAYDAAVAAASGLPYGWEYDRAMRNAQLVFDNAVDGVDRIIYGKVVSEDIMSAMLLTVGNFYRNREVGELPAGAERLLAYHRRVESI